MRWVSLAWLPALACIDTVDQPIPVPNGTQSLLISIEELGLMFAREDPFRAPAASGESVFAFAYPEVIEDLGMMPGPIESVEDGVPLPEPSGAWAGIDGEWRATSSGDSATFTNLRVRPPEPEACASRGSCLASQNDTFCRSCAPDFPEPARCEATLPAPPAWTECPEGWTSTTREGTMVCAPPTARCAAGLTPFPRLGCLDASPCSSEFNPRAPRDAAHVREGGTGDGSASSPFGSLEQAVVSGASSIALGPGTWASSTPLRGVTVYGACAEETQLTGVEVEDSALFDLTLQSGTISGGCSISAGIVETASVVDGRFTLNRARVTGKLDCVRTEIDFRDSVLAGRIEGRDVSGHIQDSRVQDLILTTPNLVLSSSVLEGHLRFMGGQVDLHSVWSDTATIGAGSMSSVRMQQVVLTGSRVIGDGSRVEMSDVLFLGAPGGSLALLGGTEAEVTRTRLQGCGRPNVAVDKSRVSFTDLSLEDPVGTHQERLSYLWAHSSALSGSRVLLRGALTEARPALDLDGTSGDFSDITADLGLPMLHVANQGIRVRRSVGRAKGYVMACNVGQVDIEDVCVSGGSRAMHLNRASGSVRRVDAHDLGDGIFVRNSSGAVELEDITVRNLIPVECGAGDPCSAVGITSEASTVRATRFLVQNAQVGAVAARKRGDLDTQGSLRLEHGSLLDNHQGVSLIGPFDPRDCIINVLYSGNTEALVTSEE